MYLSRTFKTFAVLFLSTSTFAIEITEETNKQHEVVNEKVDTFENFLLLKETSTLLDMKDEFVQWMEKFDKAYHSLEEQFERMLVWVKNHEFIETHNNQSPKPSYTVGHNEFSDMTNDEFQKQFSLGKYSPGIDGIRETQKKAKELTAMRKVNNEEEHPSMAEFRYLRNLATKKELDTSTWFFDDQWFKDDDGSDDDGSDDDGSDDDGSDEGSDDGTDDGSDTNGLPDSIDWVTSGAVTPVKNQASCGSCWAFSATGAIEGAAFVKYGELIALSEQNLLDCDTVDNGCNGGLMDNAFKFDETAKGLCSEADYPYLATDGHECLTNCTKVAHSIVADYNDLDESDKHGLLASIALQPTSVAMQADQLSFQFYSQGVFSEPDCGASGAIDHGVLAVGYGTDEESGKDFFKIKNSWGDSWGEGGYFRLDRKSKNQWGTCALLMIMTAPIMA
jgi:C1A family cysteine protease